MVSETILCDHCGSDCLRLDGKAPSGKQKYFCNACRKGSRQNPKARGYGQEFQAQVLAAYHERASLRGVCRIFGLSRQTLITWLKKESSKRFNNILRQKLGRFVRKTLSFSQCDTK